MAKPKWINKTGKGVGARWEADFDGHTVAIVKEQQLRSGHYYRFEIDGWHVNEGRHRGLQSPTVKDAKDRVGGAEGIFSSWQRGHYDADYTFKPASRRSDGKKGWLLRRDGEPHGFWPIKATLQTWLRTQRGRAPRQRSNPKEPKTELARVREFTVTKSRLRKIYGRQRGVEVEGRPWILSYGGGVDSFAMLVASLERGAPPSQVVFADVTDPRSVTRMLRGEEPVWELGESPGEWPGTYRHLVDVAIPLMEQHGIPFHWLTTEAAPRNWPWRQYARNFPILGGKRLFGEERQYGSLIRYFYDARMMFTTTKMGGRVCTNAAKVRRISRWVRSSFDPREPLEMWIGFDAEEIHRIQQDVTYTKKATDLPGRVLRYPLMEWNLCRCRCVQLIRDAGFPVPRKSACTFCGYSTRRDWRTLAVQQPETFQHAVDVEGAFKGTAAGKMLFFSGDAPLREHKAEGRDLPLHMMGWSERTKGVTYVKAEGCPVCKAEVAATKATAVGYLDEPTPEEMMEPRPGVRALVGLPPAGRGQMELLPENESEIVASVFAEMLKEENPPHGPALHWLVTA